MVAGQRTAADARLLYGGGRRGAAFLALSRRHLRTRDGGAPALVRAWAVCVIALFVIPAPLASEARKRDQAGTQTADNLLSGATAYRARLRAEVSYAHVDQKRSMRGAWVPAWSRVCPVGHARRRDDGGNP